MIKDDHVFTVQAHPEFVSGVVKEVVRLREKKRIFTSELAQRYLIAAGYDDDSVWVGQKCIEFLAGRYSKFIIIFILLIGMIFNLRKKNFI